jgi:hypothetical protein
MYVGRVTPEGIEWATEDWSATTKNLIARGAYNAGIIARSREFTANEKALVERYFARQLPTLGQNEFVNSTFDTDLSGWLTLNAGGGQCVQNAGRAELRTFAYGDVARLRQSISAPIGKQYCIKYDLIMISGTSISSFNIGTAIGGGQYFGMGVAGEVTGHKVVTSTAEALWVSLYSGYSSGGVGDSVYSADNISVSEVL